jgi:hypothetical protein
MKTWSEAAKDSAFTGSVASAATAAVAAALGKAETGSPWAPLNAVSHALWGDRAARRSGFSGKYTVTGTALNQGGAMVWALVYEKFFGRTRSVPAALLGGAAVAALAFVVDYYVVPKRLTPGYEKRLSPRSLAGIYGALALGLGASTILRRAGFKR